MKKLIEKSVTIIVLFLLLLHALMGALVLSLAGLALPSLVVEHGHQRQGSEEEARPLGRPPPPPAWVSQVIKRYTLITFSND